MANSIGLIDKLLLNPFTIRAIALLCQFSLVTVENLVFPNFEVGCFVFQLCSRVFDFCGSVCATIHYSISKESHWEKFLRPLQLALLLPIHDKNSWDFPAEIPLEIMVDLVFFPMWIILVPVSAYWLHISNRDWIKFSNWIISFQNTATDISSYSWTCFNLSPRFCISLAKDLFLVTKLKTPLSFFITRIPVLNCRIFDFGIVQVIITTAVQDSF